MRIATICTVLSRAAILLCISPQMGRAQSTTPRSTFSVGSASAARGTRAYGELAVPAGADASTNIPVVVIHGALPGPTVAFVSGAHGTEYASSVALMRLIERVNPQSLVGTVIIAPLLNVASFEQMTVHTNPVDKKGMNAVYPGNAKGTQSERALAMVAEQIVGPADVIIDLHGGDLDEDLRPYSYWTRTGHVTQDSATRALVMAFGIDHVIVRDLDISNPASTRSLSSFALSRGKYAMVAEAGRSGLVLPDDVEQLVKGSLRVLGALHMTSDRATSMSRATWLGSGSRITADKPGMFFAMVSRDTKVKAGQVIGYTTDYLGRRTGQITAPIAGLVGFIRGVPSMWAGATLANVSPILKSVPAYVRP
ncbi:MAG: succinylglutamate desuccinylase/aspartoacylase family protein [Gemmatimonas sp.]